MSRSPGALPTIELALGESMQMTSVASSRGATDIDCRG